VLEKFNFQNILPLTFYRDHGDAQQQPAHCKGTVPEMHAMINNNFYDASTLSKAPIEHKELGNLQYWYRARLGNQPFVSINLSLHKLHPRSHLPHLVLQIIVFFP
jgi:hypothetical protein